MYTCTCIHTYVCTSAIKTCQGNDLLLFLTCYIAYQWYISYTVWPSVFTYTSLLSYWMSVTTFYIKEYGCSIHIYRYSCDEGINWSDFNFTDAPVTVWGVITEPEQTTTQVL